MFDVISKFVSGLAESEEPETYIHSRMQLAEAALMYHVIAADGIIRQEEQQRMNDVLREHFKLGDEETGHLLRDAETADNEAIDLYSFTSSLKQALNREQRIKMIENLWEMVFADGVVHELEDNVVWRVAELLGVDTRDHMLLKQKVWERHNNA